MVILLTVRRFICDAAHCPRRTFAEPFTQLTAPHARFTTRLNRILERVGLALAGGASARQLGTTAARSGISQQPVELVLRRGVLVEDPVAQTDDVRPRHCHLSFP
ncbi:hypothetical protein [Streptomyces lutosisoli]|uniref:hypothetical protein n=1 Tax=Streptomyces lutosisoli TaxID=2665721 RepID=UPI00360AB332